MKNLSLLFILSFLFTSTALMAQVPDPDVAPAEAAMNEGVNKCVIVEFVDITRKDAEKIWQNFSKKRLGKKSKKVKKTNEYLTDGASITGISGKQRVFTSFSETGNETQMRIWVDNGGEYVNPDDHPSDYSSIKKMLFRFNRSVERHRVKRELNGEEKMLSNLGKDLRGLEKDKSRLEGKIRDYEKKIQEAKERIAENEKEQEAKNAEIKIQSEVVDEVKTRLSRIDN